MTDQQPPATLAPAPETALSCPFCGGEASPTHLMGAWSYDCDDCFAGAGDKDTEAEAIAAWNTRTPDPALAAENARLIALVGEMREAVAAYDATVKACPANKTFLGDKPCPKCKAGPDEGCRDEIRATMPVIEAARALLEIKS